MACLARWVRAWQGLAMAEVSDKAGEAFPQGSIKPWMQCTRQGHLFAVSSKMNVGRNQQAETLVHQGDRGQGVKRHLNHAWIYGRINEKEFAWGLVNAQWLCQVWEVCDLKKVRGCKEGTRGKSQRCLSSTAGSAYVAIELMATSRRDLRSKPEELFLFMFVQKYKNYFEIIRHKSGVFLWIMS